MHHPSSVDGVDQLLTQGDCHPFTQSGPPSRQHLKGRYCRLKEHRGVVQPVDERALLPGRLEVASVSTSVTALRWWG
jgi:hypothetical protein